ncbi:MAG TPA: hypothetical protein VF457_06085 [Burkholderiaceae bacterium]
MSIAVLLAATRWASAVRHRKAASARLRQLRMAGGRSGDCEAARQVTAAKRRVRQLEAELLRLIERHRLPEHDVIDC